MKTAQELRSGNAIMVGNDPLVVQKAEYSKSGRNASVVKMKAKNLVTKVVPVLKDKDGKDITDGLGTQSKVTFNQGGITAIIADSTKAMKTANRNQRALTLSASSGASIER